MEALVQGLGLRQEVELVAGSALVWEVWLARLLVQGLEWQQEVAWVAALVAESAEVMVLGLEGVLVLVLVSDGVSEGALEVESEEALGVAFLLFERIFRLHQSSYLPGEGLPLHVRLSRKYQRRIH